MRIRQLALSGAFLAIMAAGLTGCSYTSPDAGSQELNNVAETSTPLPNPEKTLIIPKPEPGEALRLLYDGSGSAEPVIASAPETSTGYILETACSAHSDSTTVTVELTDANDPNSIILTDIVPCNGTAQVDEAIDAGLAARNVRLSFIRTVDGVTGAYSILTPDPS